MSHSTLNALSALQAAGGHGAARVHPRSLVPRALPPVAAPHVRGLGAIVGAAIPLKCPAHTNSCAQLQPWLDVAELCVVSLCTALLPHTHRWIRGTAISPTLPACINSHRDVGR